MQGILSVTPYYNKPTQEGLSSTTGRSPSTPRCRSSSTTCPAAPAATSSRERSPGSPQIPNIVGVKEASGNMTQMCEVCRARAARLLGAVGRRRAGVAADGGRWARADLGGVERRARIGWRRWSTSALAGDFAAAREDAHGAAAADARELHRVEPDSGEGRHWRCSASSRRSTGCRWCRPRTRAAPGFVRCSPSLGMLD